MDADARRRTASSCAPRSSRERSRRRTKWLMLNSPSNPSGAVYSADELRALAAVLERHPSRVDHLATTCTSTCCSTAARSPRSPPSRRSSPTRTLTVNGVSKTFAMTGWRLGYACGPAELIRAMAQHAGAELAQPVLGQPGRGGRGAQRPAWTSCASAAPSSRRGATPSCRGSTRSRASPARAPHGAFYVYVSCAGWIGKRTPQGPATRERRRRHRVPARARRRAAERRRLRPVAVLPRLVRRARSTNLEEACQRIDAAAASCADARRRAIRRLGGGSASASRPKCCTTPSAR